MRKAAYLIAILVMLPTAAYFTWVQFPRLHQPQLVQSAIENSRRRMEASQAQAEDPAVNGYLSPTFLPYWGRKDLERRPGSQAESALVAFRDYSTQGAGVEVDHAQLLKDPAYLKARKALKLLVPQLVEELRKPLFTVPEPEPDFFSQYPNLLGLRTTAQSLSGYADSLIVESKDAEAVEVLLAIQDLGTHLRGSSLVVDMIGVAIRSIASETALASFMGLENLEAEEWKEIARGFYRSVPPEDTPVHWVENQIWQASTLFEDNFEGLRKEPALRGLTRYPGLAQRERRIYYNLMTDLLVAAQNRNLKGYSSNLKNFNTPLFLQGRHGFLSAILVPNMERSTAVLSVNKKRSVLVATSAAVQAFRLEKDRAPKRLEELSTIGLKLPWKSQPVWLSYKTPDGVPHITVQLEGMGRIQARELIYGTRPWYQVDKSRATLSVILN